MNCHIKLGEKNVNQFLFMTIIQISSATLKPPILLQSEMKSKNTTLYNIFLSILTLTLKRHFLYTSTRLSTMILFYSTLNEYYISYVHNKNPFTNNNKSNGSKDGCGMSLQTSFVVSSNKMEDDGQCLYIIFLK